MSDQWYIVVRDSTGEAYSVGTVLADPMPPAFVAMPLSREDADRLNSGRALWDAATRSLVENANWVPPPG